MGAKWKEEIRRAGLPAPPKKTAAQKRREQKASMTPERWRLHCRLQRASNDLSRALAADDRTKIAKAEARCQRLAGELVAMDDAAQRRAQ